MRFPWGVALTLTCVVGAVVLAAAGRPSELADEFNLTTAAASQLESSSSPVIESTGSAFAVVAKPSLAEPSVPEPSVAKLSVAEPLPAKSTFEAVSAVSVEAPKYATVDDTNAAETPGAETVTVTGCLERDDETLRLTDTAGTDVPKSRNWKSGFLRKRPAAITLVDTASLARPGYVGKRVAATGILEDRALRLRSLQPAAGSCN